MGFSFPLPSEQDVSEYEIECAICYTYLPIMVIIDRYQLEYNGMTLLPDRSCPNEKISFSIQTI